MRVQVQEAFSEQEGLNEHHLRLLGQEVLPAMRDMVHELDLPGPYEQLPGTRPLPASGKRDPVVGVAASAT